MPKKFGKVVLASTGDLPGDKDSKVKGWVEHAGGTFVKEVSRDVTHLVCSEKAWKRYHPIVREARRMHTVHIVKLDWLEDSLLSKSGKPLDPTPYKWEQRKERCGGGIKRKRGKDDCMDGGDDEAKKPKLAKRTRTRKSPDVEGEGRSKNERVERAGKEFDEACIEFEKIMGKQGYRPFTDQSGFVYLFTLVRKDILKNRVEKHRIKVRYAPSFTSCHETFIPISHQDVDRRRKKSDDSVTPSERMLYQSDARESSTDGLLLEDPILPPCPVPLYYFPKPYPYSLYPCIASSLPRQLTSANRNLRVPIPDPWAQSLQLFVSEEPTAVPLSGNPKQPSAPSAIHHRDLRELRKKSYAAYTVYTKPGSRHVQTLVPAGSTFDFAWAMFSKFFKKKVGLEWTDVHNGWKKGLKLEQILKERVGGGDGPGEDEYWDVLEPALAKGQTPRADRGSTASIESGESSPTVTVVVNASSLTARDQMEARAMTPEEGW
ncbi:hypothetical protein G647_03404 [Cladophialophora carrionii CBS 160.54]|uniref:BRCT domain-containing protein n=1 Tax=Cladophialophora carrionii CBS 160.54 TaxID=1279043 RepID=V9DB13_9EURO|nr:uncharacterized protein G647_03404 [Cladophialophora carrionii CBS 160.54]ETI24035.1 hypothetical protein G647_03404 [Cladophialophora carrionii CBS 160.54]